MRGSKFLGTVKTINIDLSKLSFVTVGSSASPPPGPLKIDGFNPAALAIVAKDAPAVSSFTFIDVSGPSQSASISAVGPANGSASVSVFASASGSGSSSVSASAVAYSGDNGSFASASVSTTGDFTHITASLFTDHQIF